MRILTSTIIIGITALFVACSDISEDERLQYIAPATVNRAVLIEDFTGQRCVNCPAAHETIARLHEQYGSEQVIAVSIHGGALAVNSTPTITGLRTPLGDEYNQYWGVESWPSGIINRQSGIITHDLWAASVYEEIQKPTTVSLNAVTRYDAATATATVEVDALSTAAFTGKLQVWLTEDNIVAPQQMADGSMNRDYVHQHVLRAAVNGSWGSDLSLTANEQQHETYSIAVADNWQASSLSFVVFAYNADGVAQVTSTSVSN